MVIKMASWGYIDGKIYINIVNFDFFDVRSLIKESIEQFNFNKEYTLRISDDYNQSNSDYEGDIYLILRSFSSPASHDVIEIHPRIRLRHIDEENKKILFDIADYLENIIKDINEMFKNDGFELSCIEQINELKISINDKEVQRSKNEI